MYLKSMGVIEAEDIQDYKDRLFHEIAKQIADTLARRITTTVIRSIKSIVNLEI